MTDREVELERIIIAASQALHDFETSRRSVEDTATNIAANTGCSLDEAMKTAMRQKQEAVRMGATPENALRRVRDYLKSAFQ